MLDQMQKTMNRNLLKYSAGHAIFCPHCDQIADYRRWALVDDEQGNIVWQGCTKCLPSTFSDVGYKIVREIQPKTRKAPKLPDSVLVRSIGGGKLESIPAIKAFKMYGHNFYAHPSVSRQGFWTVTHDGTGTAVCCQSSFKSKAAAILAARANLERVGSEGFAKAVEQALNSMGKG